MTIGFEINPKTKGNAPKYCMNVHESAKAMRAILNMTECNGIAYGFIQAMLRTIDESEEQYRPFEERE
jgi:hypothetical protein